MNQTTSFVAGIVAPLDIANVDTDQIIPKQFLTSVSRDGFADALFYDWRYQQSHNDSASVEAINHNFVLNRACYRNATVLLTRENFGCGSSREHAVWALQQYGFKCIIAPSFADIFYSNAINNGLLLITLSTKQINALFKLCDTQALSININLADQQLIPDKHQSIAFNINTEVKERLLHGIDFIGIAEQYQPQIEHFVAHQAQNQPWLL
ncbi:3-isopropylmalate dehydratase small subunit [Flocculibacter collagenilyticus]|uniref:3-isopropylmalate dehydratase small subunit n=1 Tax=Flocculibacter collagenilyticus TaxID=2744479 RepID=UPI0018F2B530|nr:3-isopropylmalate dehydratase small subunit [Flocculibacter collagenilyticus]